MSALQKLIVKFNAKKNPKLYISLIKEIQSAQMLWASFSPDSNNYYLGNEKGKAAAYIFSEKDYFEAFRTHEAERKHTITAVENPVQYRMAFFADLYRSGFEVVVIDNGQTYLILDLFDIIDIVKQPEHGKNKDPRLITNPTLVRMINWFLQENAKTPADKHMWELLMSEFAKAEFMLPTDTSKLDFNNKSGEINLKNNSEVSYPILQNSAGESFYPFFTDYNELRKYDTESRFSAMSASFDDLQRFSRKSGVTGITINPFGANIVLTANMLGDIKEITK